MQRVKLFKGLETEVEALEQQINVWVESEGAKIIQVTGNIATQSYNPAAKDYPLGGGGRVVESNPPPSQR